MLIGQDKQEVPIYWRPWEEDTYTAEGMIYEDAGSSYCSEVSRGLGSPRSSKRQMSCILIPKKKAQHLLSLFGLF